MNYLDFELEIALGSGHEYPVAVIRSPAGEARETMHFPFDELALENHLLALQNALLRSGGKRRQILSPIEQRVQNFGRALFDALFIGEVRSRYAVSQREAIHQGKGLRLKLRIQSPEMAALPWEFLYDSNQAEYVCLSSNTPIVRYLELQHPPQPLIVTPPLRILGMAVTPKNLADLDIEQEKQRVEKATKESQASGLIELTWLQGQTWQSLQKAMRRGPWHIFHFIGHGGFDPNTDEGLIVLEGDEGQASYLSATHLGRLLTDHRSLRLIVLNSCEGARGSEHDVFSSTAAILVRRGVPAVLAMQYEITDRAAIELSRTFYEALADGMPADAAVSEARKAISLGVVNTVEWGTPVLYMRSPDGILFDLVPQSPKYYDDRPEPPTHIVPLVAKLRDAGFIAGHDEMHHPEDSDTIEPLHANQHNNSNNDDEDDVEFAPPPPSAEREGDDPLYYIDDDNDAVSLPEKHGSVSFDELYDSGADGVDITTNDTANILHVEDEGDLGDFVHDSGSQSYPRTDAKPDEKLPRPSFLQYLFGRPNQTSRIPVQPLMPSQPANNAPPTEEIYMVPPLPIQMEAVLQGPTGRITLGTTVLTIGRVPGSGILMADVRSSGRHAEIRPEGQGYSIVDLGSTNGTYVNEQKLAPHAPRTLYSNDRIRIGTTTFTFEVSEW